MSQVYQCDNCHQIDKEGMNWLELNWLNAIFYTQGMISLPVVFCSIKCLRAWITSVHIDELHKGKKDD